MILATAQESHEIDLKSEKPGNRSFWMDKAVLLMAEKILQISPRGPWLFLCGPGNNGGDALGLAKHFHKKGYKNFCVLIQNSISDLNIWQLSELQRLAANHIFYLSESSLEKNHISVNSPKLKNLFQNHVLIDGIFGVGLDREIQEPWATLIKFANELSPLKICLDVPSGLDATNGNVMGSCIRADHSLVVLPMKSGLFLNEGSLHAGKIHSIDLKYSQKIISECACSVRLFGKKGYESFLPRRGVSSNKTKFGHLAVVGGSVGFEGAALLCALAGLRSGVGYVSVFSDSINIHKRSPPDLMVHSLENFLKEFENKKINSVVFGPGLKNSPLAQDIFSFLFKKSIPVVLDAGGFEIFKIFQKKNKSKRRKIKFSSHWVLTPHAGELRRLLEDEIPSVSSKESEERRLETVLRASEVLGGILLFKGYRTIIRGGGLSHIIFSGNPSLAKSGTGDVLSGIIGSHLAQGIDPLRGALLGAWLHGHLADQRLKKGKSVNSLLASDLIDELQWKK